MQAVTWDCIRAAEDALALEANHLNFLNLAKLYLESGDFTGLTQLASRHERFPDLSNEEILRLSARLATVNQAVGVSLWKRAVKSGVSDDQVWAVVTIGFNLGLDMEMGEFMQRMAALPEEKGFQRIDLQQLIDLAKSQNEAANTTYQLYRSGATCIHAALDVFGSQLSTWYQRRLDDNRVGSLRQHPTYPYLHLGLKASRSAWSPFLRFCPVCIDIDRKELLETYWHRAHQLPGIEVCSQHGNRLIESSVCHRQSPNRHKYVAAEGVITKTAASQLNATAEEWFLARQAEWLLRNPAAEVNGDQLRHLYRYRLREMGYANYRSHLCLAKLERDFRASYSEAWLEHIGCGLSNDGPLWIADLLRQGTRSGHTIRHLLLIHFLQLEVGQVFGGIKEELPFGSSPWPCLNAASTHYGSPTIFECSIQVACNGQRPVGLFECFLCGFAYIRYGPDTEPADRACRHHVRNYGTIWDDGLRAMWLDPTVSLRALCQGLGVDSRTAKVQSDRLGLTFPRPGSKGGSRMRYRGPLIRGPKGSANAYKAAWRETREQLPNATRTKLRSIQPAAYAFLRRYEPNWLQVNSPPRAKRTAPRPRVNWATRDRQLAKEIGRCRTALLSLCPPVRLTRTAILREAKCAWINAKKLRLLPCTTALLAEAVEGRLTFAQRRIAAVVQHSIDIGRPLKVWQISRMAGLRGDLAGHPSIKTALRDAVLAVNSDR